jgi:hypothetical protein
MVTFFFSLSRWSRRLINIIHTEMPSVRKTQLNAALFSAALSAEYILQYLSAVNLILKTI